MDAYVIGNLLGRLLMSALLVLLALWIMSRFDFEVAKKRLRRPLPIVSVLLVFLLGLVGSVKAEERALRPFIPTKFSAAQLEVWVPARPQWEAIVTPKNGTSSVTLVSPAKFYPTTIVEFTHNTRYKIPVTKRDEVALSTLQTVRRRMNAGGELKQAAIERRQLGQLDAWVDHHDITVDNKPFEARSVFAVFENGAPLTIYLLTPRGQLSHVDDLVSRIVKNLAPTSS